MGTAAGLTLRLMVASITLLNLLVVTLGVVFTLGDYLRCFALSRDLNWCCLPNLQGCLLAEPDLLDNGAGAMRCML